MSSHSLFPDQDNEMKIIKFLKALPHLEFTDNGLSNVCKRLSISREQLDQYIDKVKQDQEAGK